MKILHLDFDDLKAPWGGGQARKTFEINRILAKEHQVTVATSTYPGAKNEKIAGINYLRIGGGNFPFNFARYLLAAHKLIKINNFDILIESFMSPISTMITPPFTKKPVVAVVDWFFAQEMSKKFKFPFFLIEKIGVQFYQYFIFPSKATQEKVLGKNPPKSKRFILLPNAAPRDIEKCAKKRIIRQKYCLFIGRFDIYQKGIDLLLKAFAKIATQIEQNLIIVGAGRDEKKIKKMIQKLDLQDKVIIKNKIIGSKKTRLLKDAGFLCIPSRYESGSLVVYEALLLKKPIIVFDIPVMREITQHQAVFVKAFNIDDLAGKILKLSKIYKNKKQTKIKFTTWEEIVKKQEKFYLAVIKKHQK